MCYFRQVVEETRSTSENGNRQEIKDICQNSEDVKDPKGHIVTDSKKDQRRMETVH